MAGCIGAEVLRGVPKGKARHWDRVEYLEPIRNSNSSKMVGVMVLQDLIDPFKADQRPLIEK